MKKIPYIIETLCEESLAEASVFLRQQEDTSLFLLGNLEAYGHKLTSAPYSGNFKLVRSEGKIIAVFCLTRGGNLLIQAKTAQNSLFEQILNACKEEKIPLKCLLGEWQFCEQFWKFLKEKDVIRHEVFTQKDILYSLELTAPSPREQQNTRLLNSDDFSQWKTLRQDFWKEDGIPNDLTEKQLYEVFLEKVKTKVVWGCFFDGILVSIAELNAKAQDLGQVGGVFTPPKYRRKGFSKAVMYQLIRDARQLHKIRKLIIFTGDKNDAARKLYESLGVQHVGYFAILFGNNNE